MQTPPTDTRDDATAATAATAVAPLVASRAASAPLGYAGGFEADPVPALRRIRALGLAWGALAMTCGVTTFLQNIYWPHEGGRWDAYFARDYWYGGLAHPTAGLLALAASFFWWADGSRARPLSATLAAASAAAALSLVPIVVAERFRWTWTPYSELSRLGSDVMISIRFVVMAGVPLAMFWAALDPRRFTPARLAALGAVAALLVAGEHVVAILSLLDSMSIWSAAFWQTFADGGWLEVSIPGGACTLPAAGLLALAATRLRSGRTATSAVCASWLLLLLVLWLFTTTYGFWWRWRDEYPLSVPIHALRIASGASYMLMQLALGLAFLLPLRPSTWSAQVDLDAGT